MKRVSKRSASLAFSTFLSVFAPGSGSSGPDGAHYLDVPPRPSTLVEGVSLAQRRERAALALLRSVRAHECKDGGIGGEA